jgi:hypothetical protein
MLAVVADDIHMLAHLAQHLALLLPGLAPAAEIILELRLTFAMIFVIVAVEFLELTLAPLIIVWVVVLRAVARSPRPRKLSDRP